VKAVIIAGGFGTRLRPLSCTRPKHLFPLAGRPLLDWTLERLANSGVDEVVFAVNYMADAFSERYGKTAFGMKTNFCQESEPLGTGGCVKNAERIIGRKQDFLLLNGDVLSELDYARLIAKHKENKGVATLALHRVKDPSRYGVVELTENNRIKRFIEKPPKGNAPSNLINAGIYALSPEIFNYIPEKKRVSIERVVFPALAKNNELFGYMFSGLWIDIGEPSDFLKGNRLLMDSHQKKDRISKTFKAGKTAKINNPVAIGEHVKVGENSTIGPYVTLSDRITVGKGVEIRNSVVLSGTTISDSCHVEGAIIGEKVSMGKGVRIAADCLIGDHVTIHDNLRLAKGVTVCPYRDVVDNLRASTCLM
jgi:mannose-1-phosphate guanylyltransferase